jgi:hypothetical protein
MESAAIDGGISAAGLFTVNPGKGERCHIARMLIGWIPGLPAWLPSHDFTAWLLTRHIFVMDSGTRMPPWTPAGCCAQADRWA